MEAVHKKIGKKILEKTWRPFLLRYLSKERTYNYKNLRLVIFPGVFHPGLFFSTTILLEFLETISVNGKKVLELGAGSGLISMTTARRGAEVFALDISNKAVANIKENAIRNNIKLHVLQSDLFNDLIKEKYDLIIVNPPYYPHNPSTEGEYAWYCGKNFEYFITFFSQLRNYIHSDSEVYMILSEDCDITTISKIAEAQNIQMLEVYQKKKLWELNYIFRISPLLHCK